MSKENITNGMFVKALFRKEGKQEDLWIRVTNDTAYAESGVLGGRVVVASKVIGGFIGGEEVSVPRGDIVNTLEMVSDSDLLVNAVRAQLLHHSKEFRRFLEMWDGLPHKVTAVDSEWTLPLAAIAKEITEFLGRKKAADE